MLLLLLLDVIVQVRTGSCDSWWIRLLPDRRPKEPRRTINWLYLHGEHYLPDCTATFTAHVEYTHHMYNTRILLLFLSFLIPICIHVYIHFPFM